jgi:myo-inositol 2-dehydrogenase / D-chiro-inositol 1-dehydrogenase
MSESLNRRDFLAAGAVAAGTLAGASQMFAQTSQTMKVGLIGCGGRGTGALRDVMESDKDVQITALCDVFEPKTAGALKGVKKRWGDRVTAKPDDCFTGLDGYKKLIAHPDVNYVMIATPPGFRPVHLEAAVEAGKHIFTEKPVAVDVAGIRKVLGLVKKSQEKNLKIAAGTQRRHEAGYIEIMKRLHGGEFGDIMSGRVYWNGTTPWFHPRQKGESDVMYQFRNWYHFLWLCGDHIVEQHVHNIDVANWALKATPIRATGMGGRSNRPVGDPGDVGHIFDHFAVDFEYPGGVIVESQCRQISNCDGNNSENFIGTKGKTYTRSDVYIANGKEIDLPSLPYVQEHADLIKAIRDDKPLNELEQVTNSTFAAILGRMSTYSGKSLKWDDVLYGVKVKQKGKEVIEDRWFEDTMPKNLSLDMAELPADPVPVVGQWKPRRSA